MKAAFVTKDYTPAPGGRFGRLGVNIFTSAGVHLPLYARLALFDDGQQQAGLLVLDQNFAVAPVVAELRLALSEKTGIPPDRFMVAATHAHNTPPLNPWLPSDVNYAFVDVLIPVLRDLAAEAQAKLRPVRLVAGLAEAPGWSYNRRPIYRTAEGREQVGTHGPRSGTDYLRMEGPDESRLLSVLAIGADGKPAGGLVNFACHPTTMYSDSRYSSDYPGILVRAMEERFRCPFVFANGAAGNLSNSSGLPGRPRESGEDHAEQMGRALAEKAGESLEKPFDLKVGPIRVAREILSIAQRRVTGSQVQVARAYLEAHLKGEPWSGSIARDLYGFAYHFHHLSAAVDDWLARDIIGMWEWQKRDGRRELRENVEIQILTVGELALAGFPAEIFNEFGHCVREQSPFPATVILEMANGWHGYIPSEEGLARGGYEACLAMQSRLAPEAGRLMAEAALRLLGKEGAVNKQ